MVLKTADEFTSDVEEGLFAALAHGASVVTANNRLARYLRLAYGRAQRERGRPVWEAPDILPWRAYVSRGAAGVRAAQGSVAASLSDVQERFIWSRLVRSQGGGFLCHDAAFGALAQEAFGLVADYGLALPQASGSLETEGFLALARAFEKELGRLQREDPARDAHRLAQALRLGQVPPPAQLLWVGFRDMTPAQENVIAACQEKGGHCLRVPLPDRGRVQEARIFPTLEEEMTAALLWAREQWIKKPMARYGLVVPDLEHHRLWLNRLAEDVLGDLSTAQGPIYEFSLGAPLIEAPVVAMALRAWRLVAGALRAADVASLIQSPFMRGAKEERSARAQTAFEVLDEGADLTLSDTISLLSGSATPIAREAFARVHAQSRAFATRSRASVWADRLMGILRTLGWPGVSSQTEYQAVAALHEALEAVAGVDALTGPLSFERILGVVSDVLAARIFQGGDQDAPLQILGPLEAAGLPFDGLWIGNLHDRVWPALRSAHPLLPLAWQREHHLPHAHIEDDIRFAQELVRELSVAAPMVVLSTGLHDGKEALRVSPVLARFHPQAVAGPDYKRQAERFFEARLPLEEVRDEPAPLVAPRDTGYGTGLFAAQAACPFKAAAQYRFQAHPLSAPSYGISPAVRGTVLHKALEFWFSGLGGDGPYGDLDEADREARMKEAVATAFAGARVAYRLFPVAFRDIEALRVQGILRAFLAYENDRPSYRVVACEREVEQVCGPLTVRGRIDRIDVIEDREVLIDYKTGRLPTLDLDTDRPQQPQLLFYATARGPAVAAFAFADLSVRGPGYKVWTGVKDLWPGALVVPDWEEKSTQWRALFDRLATHFAEGHAPVDPLPGACEHCGRESFCRVGERRSDDT